MISFPNQTDIQRAGDCWSGNTEALFESLTGAETDLIHDLAGASSGDVAVMRDFEGIVIAYLTAEDECENEPYTIHSDGRIGLYTTNQPVLFQSVQDLRYAGTEDAA